MIRKHFLPVLLIVLMSCSQSENKNETPEDIVPVVSSAPANMAGYTPTYSASFAMGNPEYAGIVLSLWRTWENGDLSAIKSSFADSVTFFGADGSLIAGPVDKALGSMQSYRDMFSSIETKIHAIFPTKSTDMNEDWVCVWGIEYQTDKKGKLDSVQLQETWRFDKNGKVDLMYQYMSPAKKTMQ